MTTFRDALVDFACLAGERPDAGSEPFARDRQAERAADPVFAELSAQHGARIHRFLRDLLLDSALAADATQETFIRVFRRLGDFRGESKLGTWIGSIAVSVSLGGLRSSKRRGERMAPLEAGGQVADTRPQRADADLGERLHRAIEELAEGYRAVFLLHDVEGYTHEEIGQMLGVTTGTSKAQLHRARGRLRETLAPFARTNGD